MLFHGERTSVPMQRIGLLPGSFNPPHRGHVELATRSVEEAGLDVCFFYVNSICERKRGEMVGQSHRLQLLEMMLSEPNLLVIDPSFFPDNPNTEFWPQERVFTELIIKLVECFDSPPEVWLIRGSDNFRPLCQGGYIYPIPLCRFPHVIGIRSESHREYDYSAVRQKIMVTTTPISSTEIRQGMSSSSTAVRQLSGPAREYIELHGLFGAKSSRRQTAA